MEFIRWFTIASFIAGAIFVMTDILTDSSLVYKYIYDSPWEIVSAYKLFAILTGTWVALGGSFQTGVAVLLSCKGEPDGPFKSMPITVRILVLVTSPILLSPVVLNVYGAYFVIRYGVTNMATTTIPMVDANLKFAEIAVESAPQLATQLVYVFWFKSTKLQLLSIITSTLAMVIALSKFISQKRKIVFISRRHPVAASLVPIALWIFLSVICGTVGLLSSVRAGILSSGIFWD